MKDRLIKEFNALGIENMAEVKDLYELKGDFINLECRLPNGETAKILDDNKLYFGAEVHKANSDRCYGVAGDEGQIVVYEYGCGGADAELIVWKRL